MVEFEPVIIGFVCNECVYAAADLAGTSRQSYPPNIRLIRVPCSGQVDSIHILRAFENGADGVFVGGCLKDQCHYVDGYIKAEKRVDFLRGMLSAIGLEQERLSIHFMSASMGREFSSFACELTSTLKKLGPNPLKRRKTSIIHRDKKRKALHDMLLSISSGLKAGKVDFSETAFGFGEPVLDKDKCLGCGACGFVCRDGAITVTSGADKVYIKNTYWRCTACARCKDVCPKECLDVKEGFDLSRFLEDKEDVKAEVGLAACKRCDKSFLPVMLVSELEEILTQKSLSPSFLSLCPTCRTFDQAEKVRSSQ